MAQGNDYADWREGERWEVSLFTPLSCRPWIYSGGSGLAGFHAEDGLLEGVNWNVAMRLDSTLLDSLSTRLLKFAVSPALHATHVTIAAMFHR